jgi:hypothetical protein
MRRLTTLSAVAATATLFALSLALAPSAQAQGGGRRGGQGFNGQGPGFGAPGMMAGGGMNVMRDPMRGAETYLVQRDDVQHELMLDGRQQQQIGEAIQKGRQDTMEKMRAARVNLQQKMQSGGQNLRDMTPEERQAYTQQVQKQMQDAIAPILAEQDKAVESVLNKKQIERLHQLDLQWRSALALNDSQIGDQFALAPEQKQKVAALYQEYNIAQRQAMQSIFGGFGLRGARRNSAANGQPGDANGGAQDNNGGGGQQGQPGGLSDRPSLDPQAVQERMQQAQKTINKALAAGADKAFALLAPEQQAQWRKMVGAPFTFKENSPMATYNQ